MNANAYVRSIQKCYICLVMSTALPQHRSGARICGACSARFSIVYALPGESFPDDALRYQMWPPRKAGAP